MRKKRKIIETLPIQTGRKEGAYQSPRKTPSPVMSLLQQDTLYNKTGGLGNIIELGDTKCQLPVKKQNEEKKRGYMVESTI